MLIVTFFAFTKRKISPEGNEIDQSNTTRLQKGRTSLKWIFTYTHFHEAQFLVQCSLFHLIAMQLWFIATLEVHWTVIVTLGFFLLTLQL